ncbi:Zn-dependent dipeptidase, dipeptidase homolog [Daejeonella rubra]|uniref:Zn-dependent dipeptidase, dipeptidase homolog n=1 Tax=Daejeonella rubra TaxID=990371 RepID=A0A1G9SEZ1_9SPHI|nr:membrane dipeptidase [Daejeonella rubra]SDM34053.1 Zn-dependent dipeptidase, dipeptidase homolog [Daejeonella rubra]
MKRSFKLVGLILLGLLAFFFIFVPRMIDSSKNKISIEGPFERVSWYDSIPFIADLHCDALLWDRDLLKKHDYGHVDLPRMQTANMAFQVFTIVSKVPRGINIEQNDSHSDQIGLLSFAQLQKPETWFNVKERALNQARSLYGFADRSEGKFRVITNKDELQKFITDRESDRSLSSGMLGLEGAHCLDNDIKNLDVFYKAGIRYIGLAHFFDNEWAGSAHGMKKGGLTEKGIQLVKKMDSLHMTVDLAHSSQQTIEDVFKYYNGPLLVSHTGVRGVCDNQRNLSDEQLLKIGARKGLVGIGLWETAVCGKDAAATAKTIKYVADMIGVDRVALGSDWDGAYEMHFDVTGAPLIVAELLKLGFTRLEIEKIMGGNIRDFFLSNLPD